jgi:hypothetical protein
MLNSKKEPEAPSEEFSTIPQEAENSGNSGEMLLSIRNLQKRLYERGPSLNLSKVDLLVPSDLKVEDLGKYLLSRGKLNI